MTTDDLKAEVLDILKGRLIVFEGVDCCGKTTMVEALTKFFKEDAISFREPGGTSYSERIRTLFIDSRNVSAEMSVEAEILMMMSQRSNNMTKLVKPAIEAGKMVFADRGTPSTFAYNIASHKDVLSVPINLYCEYLELLTDLYKKYVLEPISPDGIIYINCIAPPDRIASLISKRATNNNSLDSTSINLIGLRQRAISDFLADCSFMGDHVVEYNFLEHTTEQNILWFLNYVVENKQLIRSPDINFRYNRLVTLIETLLLCPDLNVEELDEFTSSLNDVNKFLDKYSR